jgi:DNA (cytosine-5)-methyltransferase 1
MSLRYLSVCSGIEAATQAWHPLGWQPVAFSEVAAFPAAVLAHHYPGVPNWGDMTRFQEWPDDAIDLLVGGTPCQSFSVAGLRAGLDDPRGNLMLTYGAIAGRYRPRWLVWENVPGVLSSNGGRDFAAFLGLLGELGYGWAYRVLDAQHVRTRRLPRAIPQRRRRVFVVGYIGDWRRAAAVLFDRESLSGHPAPRREAGPGVAVSPCLRAQGGSSHRADREAYVVALAVANPQTAIPVACRVAGDGAVYEEGAATAPLTTGTDSSANILAFPTPAAVRRLTPRECERLMGFPDDFTLVPYRGKPAKDGPRYKALGNSMAINCMEWIGERIAEVDRWSDAEADE